MLWAVSICVLPAAVRLLGEPLLSVKVVLPSAPFRCKRSVTREKSGSVLLGVTVGTNGVSVNVVNGTLGPTDPVTVGARAARASVVRGTGTGVTMAGASGVNVSVVGGAGTRDTSLMSNTAVVIRSTSSSSGSRL